MSPEDLAGRCPLLYHVTDLAAVGSICRHGLLSTSRLLDLFELAPERRAGVEAERRLTSVVLTHPLHGRAVISDNLPLTARALSLCLEDGLTSEDWLRMLNRRVFFWPSAEGASRLLAARVNRGRSLAVLVLDTLTVARHHHDRIELSPINSGATMRRAARRGRSTFAPMDRHGYEDWRRLRGGLDRPVEITVVGGVDDVADHLLDVCEVQGCRAPAWPAAALPSCPLRN